MIRSLRLLISMRQSDGRSKLTGIFDPIEVALLCHQLELHLASSRTRGSSAAQFGARWSWWPAFGVNWRATADEDGRYSFAVAL
jgi:hypothetical protein